MSINTLFRIADAAKNCGMYDIANAAFAVLAYQAIAAQRFGSHAETSDASRVAFLYECDGDDIIGSLADPDGAGYYDLPALSFHGETLLGGASEAHYLCVPLPLVSRFFINNMVRLIRKDDTYGTCWIERRTHERRHWRLSPERCEAARRDLWRRLIAEVGEDFVQMAAGAILYSEPDAQPEPEFEEYEQPEVLSLLAQLDE